MIIYGGLTEVGLYVEWKYFEDPATFSAVSSFGFAVGGAIAHHPSRFFSRNHFVCNVLLASLRMLFSLQRRLYRRLRLSSSRS